MFLRKVVTRRRYVQIMPMSISTFSELGSRCHHVNKVFYSETFYMSIAWLIGVRPGLVAVSCNRGLQTKLLMQIILQDESAFI